MSDIDQQEFNAGGAAEEQKHEAGADERSEQEKEADRKLADRLSLLIEHANEKCVPLCNMIRKVRFQSPLIHAFIQLTNFVGQHFDHIDAQKEEDRDENELIKAVKPLLQQAETILNETNGAIRGADPDNRLSNKAKRNAQDHKATPEEQRLAEALKIVCRPLAVLCQVCLTPVLQMVQEVGGTIEWAKDKLDSFPKAKKDLGPLLDALGRAYSSAPTRQVFLTYLLSPPQNPSPKSSAASASSSPASSTSSTGSSAPWASTGCSRACFRRSGWTRSTRGWASAAGWGTNGAGRRKMKNNG
jgi:hypothetical protein